ncbi:2-oxo acid dehydrogenase subunit E2 [Blochmannia endosymbiont of Colobopsis nipponica]|uniref:2-oxo acid dehydrogenase subunit E2 n=1 Tax=Blochmannia endosymbiont of Colobopsis nipponica TaxID=2681987 RepID=UPI00177CDDDF|nr:2-oxo acid dehydrogenase subunit E2 [Blochmannia endosymbiont of Colobopsis nipponica]QOI11257.1 2-oxo acid dehydrogenase subunit E2 [Blochmannia endosymbiont of Colobopsis nipponica]
MAIAMNMPDVGVNEVEIIEIMVKVGDFIKVGQSLMVVESDKASMDVPSTFTGVIESIPISVGDKIKTGSLIMFFDIKDNITKSMSDNNKNNLVSTFSQKNNQDKLMNIDYRGSSYIHATPLIRRMAREFGINLSHVKGSGHKGRILREDVQSYIKNSLDCNRFIFNSDLNCVANILHDISSSPDINFRKFGNVQEVKLNRVQKISGANLYRNWIMIPHVTQFDEVDITEVEKFRKQQNSDFEKKKISIKITILIFIMKAVAKALEKLPRFNSSLSKDGKMLILKEYINIGIAVDTSSGLYVPVLRDVNKKGVIVLSRELAEISKKTQSGGKFTALDLQGSSFTISNLGGIGGASFTPIINAPEVAILGVSRSLVKPVWNGKKFIPRLMLPLSLSYDHRVIDGADGARFITLINQIMSDIRYLIM